MLAPELRDSTICSTPYDLVFGDSVTYFDQTSSCSIFDQLFICDTWTLIQTYTSGPCSDDSLCTFNSVILVYMLDLFSTFYMMYF